MKNIFLIAVAITMTAISAIAQPTSIRIISPGNAPGETYRAGNSYDITYDTVGTYHSRFKFQFGTSVNGPWTDLVGATNVIDSNASGQVKRGLFIGGFRAPATATTTGYVRMILLNADGTPNMNVTDISDNSFTIARPPSVSVDSVLKDPVASTVTLSRKKVYGIKGYFHILAGGVVTIEPGTVIMGDEVGVNSGFVVNRGGKVIADGRADAPIVFTSSAPVGQRRSGDWGGLLIFGKARINNPGGEAAQEGGVADANDKSRWYYGGSDDNDNSGILRYVRVEFGGIALQPNQELNGITLGAVGRGTTIDNVQVSFAGDDSYEWFGGSVNAKHLISLGCLDDDFDTDNGFSGKVQFVLSQRYPAIADQSTSQAFESDNDATATANQPYTQAIFSNVTSIGPLSDVSQTPNARFGAAAQIRRNSRESIINSVFMGWGRGLEIAQANTMLAAFNDSLAIRNNSWYGIKTTWLNLAGGTAPVGFTTDWIGGASFGNTFDASSPANAMLEDPFVYSSSFNPMPKAGSPVLQGASFARQGSVPTDDSFFEAVSFRGAFGGVRWDKSWANYDPINTVYVAGGPTASNGNLKLLYPNGGEKLGAGSAADIKYDTSNTYGMKFKFQFGTTPSGPWTDITSATSVSDATARGTVKGGFAVPSTLTTSGYLRIVMLNDNGSTNEAVADVSDAPFTIMQAASPNAHILSPGGKAGEIYRAGNSYDITYDTAGNYHQRFKFQFGTSSTGPWMDLPGATNVIDSNASGQVKRGLFIGGFRAPAVGTQTGYVRMVLLSDTTVTDISDNPFTVERPSPTKVDSILKDPLSTTATLSNTKIYGIRGYFHVLSGGVLTIEPGTIIMGDTVGTNSAVVINRGAKIMAEGTQNLPIVFTSSAPPGQRSSGDWGGLLIYGKARINNPGGEAAQEGGVANANDKSRWYYGGNDDDDNSGVLRYVRVEFGGIALQPNQELNGITLGGVGRGTTIDYVQSTFAGDDGFEWFGGSVNAKHIISTNCLDDDFDTDNGFSGKVQFAIAQRFKSRADQSTSQAFESDNDATATTNQPYTQAIFSNVTAIGPLSDTAQTPNSRFGAAAQIRRNSRQSIFNSLFMGWGRGIEIAQANTMAAANADSLQLRNNAWYGVKGTWLNLAGGTPPAGMDATWIAKTAFSNTLVKGSTSDAMLESAFVEGVTFNPALKSGSPLTTGSTFTRDGVVAIDDQFFNHVDFRGAMGLERWDLPWANYDPINSDYKPVVGVQEDIKVGRLGMEISPNPAANFANVRYALPASSKVTVRVVNAVGNLQSAFIQNEQQSAGVYEFAIETQDLTAGMYFVQIISDAGAVTMPLTVVK